MSKQKTIALGAAVCALMAGGLVSQVWGQMNAWMSSSNHNRMIEIQEQGGARESTGKVEIAYFSNSAFRVTSPRGITLLVDPWRNDPSGAWGLWYRVEFPMTAVDIGLSTHAHFDHDALDRLDAHMLLDRMAGTFTLGDLKIMGIADKHVCRAEGTVRWTEAVKQFGGQEPCPPNNLRHLDNTMYLIETGGMRLLMWGDNRPDPPQRIWDQIRDVDVVFLPVDSSGHILTHARADEVAERLGAKVIIPHHYLVPETTFFTSTLEPALDYTTSHKSHDLTDSATIELGPDDIADKTMHVIYFGSNNMVKM